MVLSNCKIDAVSITPTYSKRLDVIFARAKKRDGAPGEIRTPDLQLRRLPLYPAELRARIFSLHPGQLNAQMKTYSQLPMQS